MPVAKINPQGSGLNHMNNLIFSYSTKEAIQDGILKIANNSIVKEAGIKYPVLFTNTSWERYVEVPKGMEGVQDIEGRLWDILYMFTLKASRTKLPVMQFSFVCQLPAKTPFLSNEINCRDGKLLREITLKAVIGPSDIDNPEPSIFIMFPNED